MQNHEVCSVAYTILVSGCDHAAFAQGVFDEAMSTFFRNVDPRHSDPPEIPLGDGTGLIRGLKARAVLIDTEGIGVGSARVLECSDCRGTEGAMSLARRRCCGDTSWAYG